MSEKDELPIKLIKSPLNRVSAAYKLVLKNENPGLLCSAIQDFHFITFWNYVVFGSSTKFIAVTISCK